MAISDTLTDMLASLRELQKLAPSNGRPTVPIAGASGLFELMAAGGPFEEVVICRSLGMAHIYILNGLYLYIVPNGKLHLLNGQENGWYTGVFQAKLSDDLLTWPPAPSEPFHQPGNNVPNDIPDIRDRMHPTKAVWKFDEGHVYAVGPANSYVIPLKCDPRASVDQFGGYQLVISIAMVITGGTGRYYNARGTVTSLGATWFPYLPGQPPGNPLQAFLQQGALVEAKGVHCFRIMREEFQDRCPNRP